LKINLPTLFTAARIILVIALPFVNQAAVLRKCLNAMSGKDSTITVWVIFADKPDAPRTSELSFHALKRRAQAGFSQASASDGAVSKSYISNIEKRGAVCRNVFKWANAASFTIATSKLKALASEPFVKDIVPLRTFSRRFSSAPQRISLKKSRAYDSTSVYGPAFSQLNIISVPAAHRLISAQLGKAPGDGVIVGLFDSGFRLNHRCFNYAKANHGFIADSDFVEHKRDVSDPDSIRQIYRRFSHSPPEEHGSWTLSLIAGIDSGNFAGVAWGAKFVLAKTEWADRILITPDSTGSDTTIKDIEIHAEEDNWASAMVWAESLGVDIVSSSLAYSNGFTDSLGNLRPQDDYTYTDMNGATTIISKAAQEAAKRGMVIVNAIGNEGPDRGTLDAPSDVQDVISVGGITPGKDTAYFSSTGPTSDGRIKPDLVAQATEIYLPDIYSPDSAGYFIGEAGTSFSTPMVAGICALIHQTHPTDSAARLRQRLYGSCEFAVGQTAVNNTFGRGIPNALVACQSSDPVLPGVEAFYLYPNVLDIIHKRNQHIMVRFVAAADDPRNYSQVLTVAVRSVSGKLVWSNSQVCRENELVSINWPQSQKTYSPGVYYFIINYKGKSYSRKFLILG
jgi:hypothetical protein